MKKNAFTLVELLSVVIILGLILAIVTTSIFNVIEKSKTESYETQLELIKSSVKEYVSDKKRDLFIEETTICVSIADLMLEKYMEEIPIDPREGKTTSKEEGNKFSENFGYMVEKDGNNLIYTEVEDVTANSMCPKKNNE